MHENITWYNLITECIHFYDKKVEKNDYRATYKTTNHERCDFYIIKIRNKEQQIEKMKFKTLITKIQIQWELIFINFQSEIRDKCKKS